MTPLDDQPIRVLVVDDDEIDRERVRRLLRKASIDATLAEDEDPKAAAARLARGGIDVVFLDYNFPRQDGLAALRDLRAIDPLTPIIMLTGQEDTALAVELMKNGAVDYIPKTAVTAERIAHSVRHALRLRASEVARRAAEEALRASEELNRRVLESSHDSIEVIDVSGRLLFMSGSGARALELDDPARWRGRIWVDLWSEPHRAEARAAFAEAASGGVGRFVGVRLSATGSAMWWDVAINAVAGSTGRPERLVAIAREVTEQRRQAEFEQQLVGIVSHDLRNPLAAMVMGGTLLARKLEPDSPLVAVADRIVSSGQRASRLIRDLLDFTQVRLGGGIPVVRREADLHQVCRQTVDEIAINHPDRAIVHRFEGDGRGSWDADRIGQVVANLARNAVSYGDPTTPVTVRSQGCDDVVRIEVHNQGPPIPTDVVPTLFQPFARGDFKRDPERSIGLGLFIVREIVAAHGGQVGVTSSAREGTTFTVELPRASSETQTTASASDDRDASPTTLATGTFGPC